MITLLIKDFKLMFSGTESRAKGLLRVLLSLLFSAFFIGIEIFLFSAIFAKIANFSGVRIAFVRLFLILLSVFMTVSAVFRAKKLFFNEQDITQLANHPVENSKLILSKMIFLVLIHYGSSLLFEYPVFIAYGMATNKSLWFFYRALFYPLAASIFEIGVALFLVYPVRMLLEYLKRHVVLEFCLAVALIFALAFPYSKVLDVFVDLVTNNELTQLFSEESVALISTIGEHALPLSLLADFFILNRNSALFPYLAISAGVLIFGLSLTVFHFHRVRNLAVSAAPPRRRHVLRRRSQLSGLIRKELILLTKNPDYIFSFSGLLCVQPFLLYLIIRAMNAIFSSGSFLYYTTLFPNFVSLVDVFLVIMVTVIINAGANRYITMEERTIKNLKTIPVSYQKQLLVKTLIPFLLSALFLALSVLVLLLAGIMTPLTAIFSLVLALVVLLVFDTVSLREELHIRHGKPRSTFRSSLVSYVLPFAYIALVMLLSYHGVPLPAMYCAGIALFVLLGLPSVIGIARHMGEWFMELEAIN